METLLLRFARNNQKWQLKLCSNFLIVVLCVHKSWVKIFSVNHLAQFFDQQYLGKYLQTISPEENFGLFSFQFNKRYRGVKEIKTNLYKN